MIFSLSSPPSSSSPAPCPTPLSRLWQERAIILLRSPSSTSTFAPRRTGCPQPFSLSSLFYSSPLSGLLVCNTEKKKKARGSARPPRWAITSACRRRDFTAIAQCPLKETGFRYKRDRGPKGERGSWGLEKGKHKSGAGFDPPPRANKKTNGRLSPAPPPDEGAARARGTAEAEGRRSERESCFCFLFF